MRHVYLDPCAEPSLSLERSPHKIRAVVMSRTELDRIKSHMQWQAKQVEDKVLRQKQMEQMKTASKNIVKSWKNTVVNKQKERVERRLKRIQEDEDRKNAIYFASLEKAAEARKKKISDAKRMILFDRDDIHQLNSALAFSEVLKERALQVEFNNKLNEIEKQNKQQMADRIRRDVETYRQQEEELKNKNLKDMLIRKEEYIKMMKQKAENEALLLSGEKEFEKQDLIEMEKEMKKVQSNIAEEIKRKKQHVLKDALDSIEIQKQQELIRKREDEEEDKVNQIYLKVKHKIACLRKKKEAEDYKAKLEKQEQIRAIIAAGMKEKADDEDNMIAKALKEREEKEVEELKKKEAYQKRLVQDQLDYIKETVERQKLAAHEEKQLKMWEAMQRMKREEIDKLEIIRQKESEWAAKMVVRQGYNSQLEEMRELKRLEQEEDLAIHKLFMTKNQREDGDFFTYAQEVTSDCKQMERPLYPIQQAIADYRKKHGIAWREKNEKKIKEMAERKRLEKEIQQEEEEKYALTVYEPPVQPSQPCYSKSF